MRTLPLAVPVALAIAVLGPLRACAEAEEQQPLGLMQRIPWTTSRVKGSPEPPLPYLVEPAFIKINWDRPIYAKAEPGTDFLFVVQQGGEKDKPSRVLRVGDTQEADQTETVLELKNRLIYGLEFHPDYRAGGQLFVFSNGPTEQSERKNRVSRFVVPAGGPRVCDRDAEQIVIEWRSMGHDGGDLVFGHDGMLYITSGDGTSDSDIWLSAQDISNLLGGVLRIDVDHPSGGPAYSIPSDNPFVNSPGARGELWALGLRNPWRMNIDHQTGQIWVGNNGQDLWETAHLLGPGDNYGWSVYEGSHPFYLNRQRGPAPFVAPTIEHHHTEFRSLTGGVVYYGDVLAELRGAYVYGDYATGKIWGARHDGTRLTWHQELADTTLQIAAFAVSPRGDLLVVDHAGGLFRLTRTPPSQPTQEFPRRLSETGLFTSTKDHRVEAGVIPYSVNAPAWADGAHVARYLALPGKSQIEYTSSRGWNFPDGTVLMQTLSIGQPASAADTSVGRRVETRLLTRHNGEWSGYSYRWNDAQDDATLVAQGGDEVVLVETQSDADAPQRWRFPSRAECMSCHSRAVNFVLGLTELQMNVDHDYGDARGNQLGVFDRIGLFKSPLPKPPAKLSRLVNCYDESQELEARARAYLHVNCSGCHVQAGGGNARMELEFTASLDGMNIVSVHPQHDTFGVTGAMLVAPGHPDHSILYHRVSRRGRGQMPPLVSNVVDERGARTIHDWIKGMEPARKFVRAWTAEDLLPSLSELEGERSHESGRTAYRQLGCIQCHRISGEGGGAGPDLTGLAKRVKPRELLDSIIAPHKQIAPDYATTVIQTVDGLIVQGRIEKETDSTVVLRTGDPFAEPITLAKSEIEGRHFSKQSTMPEGLLNSLEQAQVLDLLAYVLAGGQP